VRFQVLTEASMKFRFVFWDVLPCKIIVNRRFRGSTYLWIMAMSNRPDDGGSTHLWKVGWQLFYTAVHPRRQIWTSSESDGRVKRSSSRMQLSPMDEMSVKKAVPQQLMDAQGWGRYSSHSFTTSELDGGEWSASRPGRALPLEKGPPVPIVQEAGWAPEPVWTQRLEEKSSCLWRGSNLDRPVVK
jgi:hypothetical protein